MKITCYTLLATLTLLGGAAIAAAPESDRATDDGLTGLISGWPLEAGSKTAGYPFSFLCDGMPSGKRLSAWTRSSGTPQCDGGRSVCLTTWTDPQSGLRTQWQTTSFADFPAAEWLLWFENTGRQDTPILARVQAMDVVLDEPLDGPVCYRLHRTNGSPANQTDFEPSLIEVRPGEHIALGGGGGRSSNKDFPFVKIESAKASYIIAVGWSGQWAMGLACGPDRRLHITAGLERTHFTLHSGERVRTPRMLVFRRAGDTLEANAQFRQLIYEHYAARRNGKPPLPTLFCNTCFTRGGGWLNECNAQNQISLIRAMRPLVSRP